MRRAAAWILATVLAAPAVLVLALPGIDFDALRCAIACGHAVRAGAVCCPTDGGSAAWKKCPPDGSVLLPTFGVPAAPLARTARLARPDRSVPFEPLPAARPRPRFDSPPDPVPLALS